MIGCGNDSYPLYNKNSEQKCEGENCKQNESEHFNINVNSGKVSAKSWE